MITSMIDSMVNPMVRQMIPGAQQPQPPTQRIIVDRTVNALEQRYSLDSNIIMGANWRLTYDFYSSSEQEKTIFASVDFDNNKVRFGGVAGLVELSIKGDSNVTLLSDQALSPLSDMVMHRIVTGVIDGTMFISVDGGTETTIAAPNNPDPFEIGNFLMSRSGAFTSNMSISNVKFEDISGGVSYTFPINTATGNTENSTEANRVLTYVNIPESQRFLYTTEAGRYLGVEVLTDNNLESEGDWEKDASWTFGASDVTSDGSQSINTDVYQRPDIPEGLNYEGIIDVTSVISGTVGPEVAGAGMGKGSAVGVFTYQGMSSGGQRTGIEGNSSFEGTVNSISIKSFIGINF